VGLVDEEMGRVEGEGVRGVNGPMITARPREGGDPEPFKRKTGFPLARE
jgi:hypothetical protein